MNGVSLQSMGWFKAPKCSLVPWESEPRRDWQKLDHSSKFKMGLKQEDSASEPLRQALCRCGPECLCSCPGYFPMFAKTTPFLGIYYTFLTQIYTHSGHFQPFNIQIQPPIAPIPSYTSINPPISHTKTLARQ